MTQYIPTTLSAGTTSLTATTANSGSVWISSNTTLSDNAQMSINGQLTLEGKEADIIINGVSLSSTLNSINDRLAILQPKPELLEKYANLREAYEHYKTLEKLLSDYTDNDK